ncbi:MAG: protein of unknown function with transrane region [Candidatus Taylorbacteria bacterium]|nr:protein of unknown function with transrane region [Candidatus Taylorbacteria bacterium]
MDPNEFEKRFTGNLNSQQGQAANPQPQAVPSAPHISGTSSIPPSHQPAAVSSPPKKPEMVMRTFQMDSAKALEEKHDPTAKKAASMTVPPKPNPVASMRPTTSVPRNPSIPSTPAPAAPTSSFPKIFSMSSLRSEKPAPIQQNAGLKDGVPAAAGTPAQSAQPVAPQMPKPELVIRTFQSDTVQAIQQKHTSVATIALSESMRKNGSAIISNEPSKHYLKKALFALCSLILLGGGAFGAYYLYLKSPLGQTTPKTAQQDMLPSIVSPDIQKIIDVTDISSKGIVSSVRQTAESTKLQQGQMMEMILATKVTAADKTQKMQKVTGKDILAQFELTPPDIFARSVTPQWMLGEYQDETGKVPFIILTNDFFQNAYAGMIKWEPSIVDDMSSIFKYPAPPQGGTGSTTDIASFFNIRGKFEDATIKNKDVRIFRNESGQTLLMYSFIDKNVLVITTGGNAIRNIVERIEKRTYVR